MLTFKREKLRLVNWNCSLVKEAASVGQVACPMTCLDSIARLSDPCLARLFRCNTIMHSN